MGDDEKSASIKKPPRPLVRLVLLLMSHRVLVSCLCCIAGIVALLILPVLAKKTYISENALMPGSASTMLSGQDVADANKLAAEIMSLKFEGNAAGTEIPKILAKRIVNLGAEASQFQFHPKPNKLHPLHFFSDSGRDLLPENTSSSWPAVSTVGIIRAPRGDGKESIVLVTPYNPLQPNAGEALSLAVSYSVFSLLTQVTWLAKDIIWVAADSRYGEHESVASWLREYYTPRFDNPGKSHNSICPTTKYLDECEQPSESFKRAGTMSAALVIKVDENKNSEDSLSILAEASNGQMPNLDLINIVNYLAVHHQGFHVKVGRIWPLLYSKCLKKVGEAIELLGNVAGKLNSQWGFGVSAGEYVDGAATLASSLYAQALGVPTGSHGSFRDYQIDALTLVISTKASPYNYVKRSEFLLRSGRLIEGVVRSVNNLLEKFHQSFFLYLLTGPSKFVSVGVYMIAFALLIAPLPIVAASLYSDAVKCDPAPDTASSSSKSTPFAVEVISTTSWRWLHAAKTVFIVHIWAVTVALYPYFICQMPNRSQATSLLSWILLSVFSLHALYLILGSPFSTPTTYLLRKKEWAILKSVMISAAFTGLSLMSVVNFAAALIGALLIVPLCLMAQPLKLDFQSRTAKAFARLACNLVLGFSVFPPFAFCLLKGFSEGFRTTNIGEFWNWAESLWLWNSATYLYVMLVHLPCWVLCTRILFHPC